MVEALMRKTVRVRPSGAALGANIDGVDLAGALSVATIEAINRAWLDHLVLRFRGQTLDDEALMRFSAHFGELDRAPVIATARVKIRGEDRYVDTVLPGGGYISVISNIAEDGVAIGALGAYESIWHTDMSYNPAPPSASALYAIEVPPSGGVQGLEFEDSEALLDALWRHATRPELTWDQQWRVGDLVLWENRCVLHRWDEFDPASRRLMHRAQIKGDRPFLSFSRCCRRQARGGRSPVGIGEYRAPCCAPWRAGCPPAGRASSADGSSRHGWRRRTADRDELRRTGAGLLDPACG